MFTHPNTGIALNKKALFRQNNFPLNRAWKTTREFKKNVIKSDKNSSLKQTAQTATQQVNKKTQRVKRKRYELDFLNVYPSLRENMGYYSCRQEATFLFGLRKDPKISKRQTFDLLKQIPEFIVSQIKTRIKALMHFSTESPRTDLTWKESLKGIFCCLVVRNWELSVHS